MSKDPVKNRAHQRAWYARNKASKLNPDGSASKPVSKRSKRTPEQNRAHQRAWAARNPDKVAAKWEKYQAALAAAGPGWDSTAWNAALSLIWAGECAYCRRTDQPMTADHVVPLTRGGSHRPENLVPACKQCNSSKGSRLLTEWRDGAHVGVAALAREIAFSAHLLCHPSWL